jgi:hypothetical protein
MPDKPIELAIEVPAETRRAIEGAAAAKGVSVAEFLQDALRGYLADTGYLEIRRPPAH